MNKKQYFVYILTNKIHTVLYVGITSNLVKRIWLHKEKLLEGFTKKYNVIKLVYYEVYNNPNEAISREKQIKKYRREKKNSLINLVNPEWKELISVEISPCRFWQVEMT